MSNDPFDMQCGVSHEETDDCIFPYCSRSAGHDEDHACSTCGKTWEITGQRLEVPSLLEQEWEIARRDFIKRLQELHDKKRAAYTTEQDHPLANYLQASDRICSLLANRYPEAATALGGLGPVPAMIARLAEKVYRVSVVFGNIDLEDDVEKIEDDLLDIANIALLLYAQKRMMCW